jgi:glycosyltransferase involved in cell wall biosynthesis
MLKVGDIHNGYEVLPKNQRPTILLLSDDLRMTSGVGNMSREFVMGTLHRFNWVQVGGAIKHPDEGQNIDMSQDAQERTGIPEADLKIHPVSGYGNQEIIRSLIAHYRPAGFMIYTDPRFWEWFFAMEKEIRALGPVMYYNIWDDLPYPMWNQRYYESVDALFNISKQTVNIVRQVRSSYEDWQVTYIPHGINEDDFFPLPDDYEKMKEFEEFKTAVLDGKDYKRIFIYNARNIRRKLPADIVYAFRTFCDSLSKEDADKCALLMHTQPQDENGTDLAEVVANLCADYDVIFSTGKLEREQLNWMYNLSHCGVLISSNEGFGLMGAECLITGIPVIVNVSGGMQDYLGFKKEDGSYLTVDDYTLEWGSNHDGRYKDCGDWAFPVFPASRNIQGSIPTPYISDDRPDWQDVAIRMKEVWDMLDDELKSAGMLGREFILDPEIGMTAHEMNKRFTHDIQGALKNWRPRKRFKIFNATKQKEHKLAWNGLTVTKEI